MQFTDNGLLIDGFNSIFSNLQSELRTIYGSDIDLSQNTPDGQRVAIISTIIDDLQQAILELVNNLDPDYSRGRWLDMLSKYSAIIRKPATRSSVLVTVNTDRVLTLPTGFTVEDDLGNKWVTTQDYSLNNGSNSATMYANEFGAVTASIGTVNEIDTRVIGVVSVYNPSPSINGVDEESDIELRQRRRNSVAKPSYSILESLKSELNNLQGVTNVEVYENATHNYNSDLQLNPHSIWVVIDGGDNQEIVNKIAIERTLGCGMKGSELGVYSNTIEFNGQSYNNTMEIQYTRPEFVDLYININISANPAGSFVDTQKIKDILLTKKFLINEDLLVNSLHCLIYQAGNNFIVTSIIASDNNVSFSQNLVESDYDKILRMVDSNITITVS